MRGLRASGRLTKEHSGSASELHISLSVSGGDRCEKRDHLGPRNASPSILIATFHESRTPSNNHLATSHWKRLRTSHYYPPSELLHLRRVKGTGNTIHEYDDETRLVHFCLHLEIKDKLPQTFDKIGGTWYHKDPGDIGSLIPSTSARMIPLPPGIPTMI